MTPARGKGGGKGMNASRQETHLRNWLIQRGPYYSLVKYLASLTPRTLHRSPQAREARETLQDLALLPSFPVDVPTTATIAPHPPSPDATELWAPWLATFLAAHKQLTAEYDQFHYHRRLKARNQRLTQRHIAARTLQVYKTTKYWNNKRAAPRAQRNTTWTTENDFKTDTCRTFGCCINEQHTHCTMCNAAAYVTAAPAVLLQQARAAFHRKAILTQSIPPQVTATTRYS